MVGESSHIKSGFGNYTREILSRLHNTNKYEIAELSCYRTNTVQKTEPWKVYPCAVGPNHPSFNNYISNIANEFGQWRFDLVLLHFKPDIVIDIRDFWNFQYQEFSPLREFFYWVLGPTYDSSPQKIDVLNTLYNADEVVFHTEWAKNDLVNYDLYNQINSTKIVNDSVNPSVFKPISYNKKFHKSKYGIDSDSFIIGSVMRNQKRKLIAEIFQILKSLPNKTYLYLHTSFPEYGAWDIPTLLLEYGVINRVLFTYICRHCNSFFPSVFKGSKAYCNQCKNIAHIWNVSSGLPPKQLCDIYNIFDIYLQYAICEGFGIPQTEAAACGIPVITVNHGAMADVGKNIGADMVRVSKTFKEVETGADRVYPDNEHCIKILQEYINNPDKLKLKAKDSRQNLIDNYSWSKTALIFENLIDNAQLKNNQGKWDMPERILDTTVNIPNIESNRDFVYYIVDHIINEPRLKSVNFIEDLVYQLDTGISIASKYTKAYNRSDAVKSLEIYINNKIGLEKIRVGKSNFPESAKEFLEY